MTPLEAAQKLDGNQYGKEGSPELFSAMKAAGLVAVFGYSDDNAELRGAIDDEIGMYGGGEILVTSKGLVGGECENHDCPHEKKLKKAASVIKALWDDGGFSWRYKTTIPHETFVIHEDADKYCEGIVFALTDVSHDP